MKWLPIILATVAGVSAGFMVAKAVDARKTAVRTRKLEEKRNRDNPVILRQNFRALLDDKELINRTLEFITRFDLGKDKKRDWGDLR